MLSTIAIVRKAIIKVNATPRSSVMNYKDLDLVNHTNIRHIEL